MLRQERGDFKAQVDFLTKKLFVPSSEKGVAEIPGQVSLFNEAETLQAPVMATREETAAQEPPHQSVNPGVPMKSDSKGCR